MVATGLNLWTTNSTNGHERNTDEVLKELFVGLQTNKDEEGIDTDGNSLRSFFYNTEETKGSNDFEVVEPQMEGMGANEK